MKPRNEGSAWEGKSWEGKSWVDRFPDATREFRILSNKSFWWKVKKALTSAGHYFMILVGFGVAAILILLLMGLLKAFGVREL